MPRQMHYRVMADEGGPNEARLDVVNLRISQELRGAAPAVATIDISGPTSLQLEQGMSIRIYQLDAANVNLSGTYNMWQIFDGEIDSYSASSYPKAVTLTCADFMSRLQRVRTADTQYSAPVTDGDMTTIILTYCGVPYDPDDIHDTGFVLNVLNPLFWKSGQMGQELQQEIDEITGCATFMLGNGQAIRIPWAPYGKPYSELIGTDEEIARVRRFFRGQTGIMFYNDDRERGSLREVKTFVRVAGYSYQDEEGCGHQIIGEARADEGVLGATIYTGSHEISSELIQTPAGAARVAKRELEWHNRLPDSIKLIVGNDRRITVGDVVAVYDPTWGNDLNNNADPLAYRALRTERDGDLLTVDCIGGPIGDSAGADIDGHDEVCCGTQADDGTCIPEDPSGPDPDDGAPDVPGIPDAPIIECDPITDTSCIPDNDPDIPEPPDQEKPYIGCTDTDYTESFSPVDDACLGSPPPNPCWGRIQTGKDDLVGSLLFDGYTCNCELEMPWRDMAPTGSNLKFEIDDAGDLVSVAGRGELRYNSELDHDLQTLSTDIVYPPGFTYAFEAMLNFGEPTATFEIVFETVSGSIKEPWVIFYTGEGLEVDDCFYGWWAHVPEGAAAVNYCSTPRNTSPSALARNTGTFGGSPAPLNQDVMVGAYFDMSGEYKKIDVYGDLGSGYAESERAVNITPLHYDPDDQDRYLTLKWSGPVTLSEGSTHTVKLKSLILGHSTCERNPHYLQPGTDI